MKHHLLELKYFTAEQTVALYQEMLCVCREVREQCVPLVDAWNVPDWILKAPMGKEIVRREKVMGNRESGWRCV